MKRLQRSRADEKQYIQTVISDHMEVPQKGTSLILCGIRIIYCKVLCKGILA